MLEISLKAAGRNEYDLVELLKTTNKLLLEGTTLASINNEFDSCNFSVYSKAESDRKYYVATLYERNGNYEYNNKIVFEVSKMDNPEKRLLQIAKSQYESNDIVKDGDGYYFNCGEVYVEGQDLTQIDIDTYNTLKKYL